MGTADIKASLTVTAAIITGWERVAMAERCSSPIRVAWFSPINSGTITDSVGAYCTDQLLPRLRSSYGGEFAIDLFTNTFERYRDFPTYHYLSAFQHHRRDPYDIVLYQLEDKPCANFVRVHLGQLPGMVLFHDFIFTNFGPEPILNSPWELVAQRFQNGLTPWPEREGEFTQYGPLGYREAAWATQAIFSNPVALSEYQRCVSQRLLKDCDIPRPFRLPIPVDDQVIREVRPFAGRICYAGSPQIEHRSHKVLQALSTIELPFTLHWLVAGREKNVAEERLREFGIRNGEVIVGRTPTAWQSLARSCDIALHPLFSVFGQPDPYLSISMALGLPSIVSSFGAPEFLSDAVVFKVEAGDQEAQSYHDILAALLQGTFRDHERVRQGVLEVGATPQVTADLAFILRTAAPQQRIFYRRWGEFADSARRSLLAEARELLPGADEEPFNCWKRIAMPVASEFGWGET